MKLFGLLLTLFFAATAVAQVNQTDSRGRKQGKWQKIYPRTRVFQYKGQFKDDKPVGTFHYYYKSSKVQAIIEHDENSNRSEAYFYHEAGGLMSYGIYRNQKKDSIWVGLDNTGTVRFKETYKNGELNGKKYEFFPPEQGTKKQMVLTIRTYKNGILNGEFKEYFENGMLREQGSYVNNKKHGEWHTYHSTGKKMMFVRYKNGIRHGWCYGYDEAGKEIAKEYFFNGDRYTGKRLKELMAKLKEQGINPNE